MGTVTVTVPFAAYGDSYGYCPPSRPFAAYGDSYGYCPPSRPEEKFAELAERRGDRVAKAWFWSQAARSALFFAVRWGRRLLELEAILRRIL